MFLTAWRRFDRVPDDALPWLLGVARRVLANARRSAARRPALAVAASAGPRVLPQDRVEVAEASPAWANATAEVLLVA